MLEGLRQRNRSFAPCSRTNRAPTCRGHEDARANDRGERFAFAKDCPDAGLKATFGELAQKMQSSDATILKELADAEGKAVELGGDYRIDRSKADAAMRPSKTLDAL